MVLSKDLKIAICFSLIMGAILSLCNLCFAVESEEIDMSYVDGVSLSYQMKIIELSGFRLYYLELERGYTYDISFDYPSNTRIGFSDSVDVGSSIYNYALLQEAGTYHTFIDGNQIQYIFFDVSAPSSIDYTITRTKKEGMTNFIDNIAYSLSIGNLSSVLVLVVPVLAISVLFGLGFYLLKRLSNKIKRAKGGV